MSSRKLITRILLLLVILSSVGATIAAMQSTAAIAWANSDYSERLGQPCISCHVTALSSDLNARGQAFAAQPNYATDPGPAWTAAVATVPLDRQPASPVWTGAAILGAALMLFGMITRGRRRRALQGLVRPRRT